MSDKKIFLAECALYIKGDIDSVRITGPKNVVEAISTTLVESRNLYNSLHESPDMPRIIENVKKKKAAAQKLKNITGFIWPF